MMLLHEDGVAKVLQGMTTLEELLRVVSIRESTSSSCNSCGQQLAASFKFCPGCGEGTAAAASVVVRFSDRLRKTANA